MQHKQTIMYVPIIFSLLGFIRCILANNDQLFTYKTYLQNLEQFPVAHTRGWDTVLCFLGLKIYDKVWKILATLISNKNSHRSSLRVFDFSLVGLAVWLTLSCHFNVFYMFLQRKVTSFHHGVSKFLYACICLCSNTQHTVQYKKLELESKSAFTIVEPH